MKKYINILQKHEPLMDSGDYKITVQQHLEIASKSVDEAFTSTTRRFSVQGERFFLEPGSVHSIYPPSGSLGEHSNTFPHIILNRSTLPWERSADGGRAGIWLALLLFDQSETPEVKNISLGDYKSAVGFKVSPSGPNDNGPFHELGDGPDEQPVTVIDVPRQLLEKIMPSRADLDFTAHSRRETSNSDRNNLDVIGPERAVLIGNRLPKSNSLSTVHLVSLENRYLDNGEFNYGNAGADDPIRLISLKSWSFTSVDAKFSLFGSLEHLNRSPKILSQPHLNDQVLNLNLQHLTDLSAYKFQVTNQGTRWTNDEINNYRFFDETTFISVEVPDSGVDADSDPQLDPFPNPEAFSIVLDMYVFGPTEANSHELMGKEENGNYKPSLWYIPSTRGFEFKVTGEDGTEYSDSVPGLLPDQDFTRIAWVKDGSEFRFYANGVLKHTAEAPARMYTKDSNYFIGKVEDKALKFFGRIRYLNIFRRALSEGELRQIFTSQGLSASIQLNNRLEKGMLAMPHHFRKGKKGVSWYRGPFSVRTDTFNIVKPKSEEDEPSMLPASSADQLMVYDKTSGMFDVSYASAWQLGRLMALEDRQFSLELFRIKKRMALEERRGEQVRRTYLRLGNNDHTNGLDDVKERVRKWMRNRHTLQQVPFHYLVPHEDMLPTESIRFFNIDPLWVRCLKDGAASIGRTTSADFDLDNKEDFAEEEVPNMSGFLLRSELVAGYPGLQILGYDTEFGDADNPDESTALKIVRKEKLSNQVLLCIFKGDVKTVDFFQKADVLHFGLDSDGGNYAKQLRFANGANLPDETPSFELKPSHFHDKEMRIFNFKKMAFGTTTSMKGYLKSHLTAAQYEAFKNFTSADFAMQMLEGAERVRFTKG